MKGEKERRDTGKETHNTPKQKRKWTNDQACKYKDLQKCKT